MATRRPKVPRAHFAGGAKVREHDETDAATAAGAKTDGVAADLGGGAAAAGLAEGGSPLAEPAGTKAAFAGARSFAAGARSMAGWKEKSRGREKAGTTPDAARRGTAGTSIPAGTGKPGAPSQPELRPVPAKAFSGRLLALAVVLLTITLLLAPSVRTFLQQRSEITSLQQDIEAKKQQQTDLKTELSRWNDPAYVKQQARDRVNMMMPGETGYWVYGGNGSPATPQDSGATGAAGSGVDPSSLPWVDGLWLSIKRSATE